MTDIHVTDHSLIAQRYLLSWFCVDLFGGLPVDWCFPSTWFDLTHIESPVERAAAAAADSSTGGSNAAAGLGLLKT